MNFAILQEINQLDNWKKNVYSKHVLHVRQAHFWVVPLSVTNVNAMEFIHMNVHSWLVVDLYLIFNLVSIHS